MKATRAAGVGMLALFVGSAGGAARIGPNPTAYPSMAPIAHYLSKSQTDEIALARSAAPAAISTNAEVLTLGPKGYQAVIEGKNHFVCLVVRAWDQSFDSAEFWNPKTRAPHCFNGAGARSVLPTYLKRTEWVLAGVSKAAMLKRTQAAVAEHQIPAPEMGAMAFMMSKDGYLGDDVGGHWHPHLMFYLPRTATAEWGANLRDSPVYGQSNPVEPLTVFAVPVTRWSDGTSAEMRMQ